MEKKTVNIDEHFLKVPSNTSSMKRNKMQKKSSVKKEQLMQVNNRSVKEILLKKLRDYRKNKSKKNGILKQHKTANKVQLNPDFMDKLRKKKNKTEHSISLDSFQEEKKELPLPMEQVIAKKEIVLQTPPPPYSNMKNTIKPTFREWKKKEQTPKSLHIETKKTFNVGKNKTEKKIGIFLKNNSIKEDIKDKQLTWKRTNMKTLKNYLKKRNLIKYGTTAPNDLLREIYECSQSCGNIQNQNGKQLVDNYLNEN